RARLTVPAPIPPATSRRIRELAIAAYRAIDCAGMARVDFFLDGDRILVNEINTIPGFTATSGYARMWEASGLGYGELLERLIELALERHREKGSWQSTSPSPGAAPAPTRAPASASRP